MHDARAPPSLGCFAAFAFLSVVFSASARALTLLSDDRRASHIFVSPDPTVPPLNESFSPSTPFGPFDTPFSSSGFSISPDGLVVDGFGRGSGHLRQFDSSGFDQVEVVFEFDFRAEVGAFLDITGSRIGFGAVALVRDGTLLFSAGFDPTSSPVSFHSALIPGTYTLAARAGAAGGLNTGGQFDISFHLRELVVVPEPSTIVLVSIGLAFMASQRGRSHRGGSTT